MTQQETNKILALMVEVYPRFNEGRNPQLTSRLWSTLFADEPYEWVEKAFMAFVATDTKGFPPSPGAIKDKIRQLSGSEEPTELQAWGVVLKAISNSAYNSKSEFDKLPRPIQEIVGYPGQLYEWSQMDSDEVNSVIASNFQRSYRARSESRRMYDMIPEGLKIALPGNDVPALTESKPLAIEEPKYEYVDMPQSIREIFMSMKENANV